MRPTKIGTTARMTPTTRRRRGRRDDQNPIRSRLICDYSAATPSVAPLCVLCVSANMVRLRFSAIWPKILVRSESVADKETKAEFTPTAIGRTARRDWCNGEHQSLFLLNPERRRTRRSRSPSRAQAYPPQSRDLVGAGQNRGRSRYRHQPRLARQTAPPSLPQ